MSKPFKPSRQSVELRPSRIRRDPVRAETVVKAESPERELWTAITGILLFAAASIALMLGIINSIRHQSDASDALRFGQCYNHGGPDCIVDGDTIYLNGQKLAIAGMDVPKIQDAECDAERDRGIDAAMRLADLLNKGNVTIVGTERGANGELLTHVEVDGQDVGAAMVGEGLAREPRGERSNWCG